MSTKSEKLKAIKTLHEYADKAVTLADNLGNELSNIHFTMQAEEDIDKANPIPDQKEIMLECYRLINKHKETAPIIMALVLYEISKVYRQEIEIKITEISSEN